MIVRSEALKLLAGRRKGEVVITTMSTIREWHAVTTNHDLDFPIQGAMGQAAPVGLGVALARPDKKVWILNGDGSQLMHLGSVASIAHNGAKNVVLFVFQNDTYEVTGGQPIPLAGKVDFAGAALALGFPRTYRFDEMAQLESKLGEVLSGQGPVLVTLRVVPGDRFEPWRPKMLEEAAKFKRALQA